MIRTANSHCCGTEFDPSVGELQAVQCGQINKYFKKKKFVMIGIITMVGCSPWGLEELDTAGRLHFHFSLSCIGEGNGKPLLPGESQGQGSLVGCHLWGRTESDTTEAT